VLEIDEVPEHPVPRPTAVGLPAGLAIVSLMAAADAVPSGSWRALPGSRPGWPAARLALEVGPAGEWLERLDRGPAART
jgi:hypothetical protein